MDWKNTKFKIMNLVIITSVINISSNSLDYTKIRNVFSAHERYLQTLLSIESISKIKDKIILFIEGSEIDKEYEKIIKNSVDIYINIKNGSTESLLYFGNVNII